MQASFMARSLHRASSECWRSLQIAVDRWRSLSIGVRFLQAWVCVRPSDRWLVCIKVSGFISALHARQGAAKIMQLTHTDTHTITIPIPIRIWLPILSCSLLCLDIVCVVYKSNNQSISLELHLFILLSKCRYTHCLMPLPPASSICLHLMMLYINCGRILGSFCSSVLRGKLIFFFATALHGSSNRCVSLLVCVC